MKLLIVGGGGFRVPQVIEVLAAARAGSGLYPGLIVDDVCLYDVDRARLDAMAAVIHDFDFPHAPRIETSTDLAHAVRGADFVFSAMRQGGTCGRITDELVALEEGVLGQETVGVGGYAYAFRTVPVALDLARTIRDLAPEAWVINFTNPAGIITQAMRQILGPRVVGICDTPIGLVRRATTAVGGDAARVSQVAEGTDVTFDYVGLNHLGWLRSLSIDGQDRLPALLADDETLDHMEEARTIGAPWIRTLGMLPNEYLFYYYLNRESVDRIRREARTRGQFLHDQQRAFYEQVAAQPERAGQLWTRAHDEREATYMAESRHEDERDARRAEDIAGGGYQQVALDLMTAIATGTPARMILDVGNADAHGDDGAGLLLPHLREDAVVEVPCLVDGDGVHPQRVEPLTGVEAGLVATVKGCEELVIDASISGDETLAWRALASHPLVDSVAVARRVLDGYLRRNPLVARTFGH